MLLRTLTVIEAVESTYKITCYTADSVESNIVVVFTSAAAGAGFSDNSGISAAWVTVDGMVDSAVSYA